MANPLWDRLFAPLAGSDRTFLDLPGRASWSHADFIEMTGRMAAALAAMGLSPGDRVAVQVSKSAEALALYGACVRAGLVFLPLNTAYTGAELAYFVEDSGAALFVCDGGDAGALRRITDPMGTRLETLNADGTGSFADKVAEAGSGADPIPRGADDLAALLYTSGTTGRSKGAMLSQKNLLSNALTLAEAWRFGPEDVLLHALPIFHTHGLFVATNVVLATGGGMIFLPKYEVDAVITGLPRATAMMGVPTFYTRLLADPRFDRDLVAGMRLFTSGSAPLLAETHRAFEERTGHRILERYGMTETNMSTSNPYDGDRRAGTVGPPLPGVELKITDPETGAEVPPGEVGQIEVRGDNVFQGYWRMPEKTREELRETGFFLTGDLATQDADGYVTIVGRAKDLIISGGFNIYPKEVEEVIDALPGVVESAVIGVPHPDFGESPVAVVVAESGATLRDETLAEALRDRLARFKQPKAWRIVDSLPRNAMGKVQKAALRMTYADIFAG